MISTWGIFWVSFFGYLTLRLVYKYFFINRLKKNMTPEKREEMKKFIESLVDRFGNAVTITIVEDTVEKKTKTKKK